MDTGCREDIYINLIHYPIRALGMGSRIGIWLQGCTIRCPGCIAKHAWEFDAGSLTTVGEVLAEISPYIETDPDGVTISGGEPFDQPKALNALLEGLRKAGVRDIMIYSGYAYSLLKKHYRDMLSFVDAIVEGPFKQGAHTDALWKGSHNQNLIILTKDKILRRSYQAYRKKSDGSRELQVVERKGKMYVIGILRQDDVEVLRHGLGEDMPNMQLEE